MFGFIFRNIKRGLVYSGNILEIDDTIEDVEAISWYKSIPKGILFEEVPLKVYGKEYKFNLPILTTRHEVSVINDKFFEYLAKHAKIKILSDITLGIWQKFLLEYDVVSIKGTGVVVFQKKENPLGKNNAISVEDKASYILRKEFLDGYFRVTSYKYKLKGVEQDLELTSEFEVGGFTIKNNYTVMLREAIFKQATKSIGTGKLLMDWQYDVIKNMARRTFICAPRRAGKSFLCSLLALREIIREPISMQNLFRPTRVLYLGLNDNKNLAIVNYIMGMVNTIKMDGMFGRDSTGKRILFKSGKKILGEILFLSAEAKDPGIGEYADCVIIDEAGKIPLAHYEGLQPIVDTEGARLIAVSTLYKHSMKGWFYEKIVESEMKPMIPSELFIDNFWESVKEVNIASMEGRQYMQSIVDKMDEARPTVALRYTIDDIEYLSERKRENIKNDYQKDLLRYMSELYSRYPDEGKVFEYEGALCSKDKVTSHIYEHVVVSYDPAAVADNPGVIVEGYNKDTNKISVIEEYNLPKTGDHKTHIPLIQSILSGAMKYSGGTRRPYFVVDCTQVSAADGLEINGVVVDLKIRYTGGSDVRDDTLIANAQKVPKSVLIDIAQTLFKNKKINVHTDLTLLIHEMEHFQKIGGDGSRLKYVGVGATDDLVNAMIMGLFFLYNYLNLKYEVMVDKGGKPESHMSKMEIAAFRDEIKREKDKVELEDGRNKTVGAYFRNNVW